eukprot:181796_1
MGVCCSQNPVPLVRHRSQISKELQQDAKIDKHKYKILILGPKRSGKSTILNQLKYLHGNGFIDSERAQAKLDIISYIIQSMKSIIECVEEYEKHKQFTIHRFSLHSEAKQSAQYIKNLQLNYNIIDSKLSRHIDVLSKQITIQKILDNADKYYIDISIRYFLKYFHRIKNINYIPSDQDIIQLRIKTESFNEENIEMRGQKFAVYDIDYKPDICNVNKYMHCFENVTAIIFVASLCSFDEPIFEDNKTYQEKMQWKQSMELMQTYVGSDILNVVLEFIGHPKNVMQQSLELFDSLCNSIWFKNVGIILFLSKSDLLMNKINNCQQYTNDINIIFKQCFPEYNNEIEYNKCSEYIKDKFLGLNVNKHREIFSHFVNGTDVTLMTKIFFDVQNVIVRASLSRGGLI